jgi:hypothetical protein
MTVAIEEENGELFIDELPIEEFLSLHERREIAKIS